METIFCRTNKNKFVSRVCGTIQGSSSLIIETRNIPKTKKYYPDKMAGTLVKFTFILFLVAMVTGQMTTPTPFSFQSKQYNNMKETPLDYPDVNSLDADFPADDVDDRSASDTVMYVDNGDYANQQPAPPPPPPQSQNDPDAKDEGIDVGDFLDTLPFDADRYSQFGGFGSAELYRLLALGPQQSDPALGFRLSGLFNRMAPKMKAPIDNLDHCPDRPEIGIQCERVCQIYHILGHCYQCF